MDNSLNMRMLDNTFNKTLKTEKSPEKSISMSSEDWKKKLDEIKT